MHRIIVAIPLLFVSCIGSAEPTCATEGAVPAHAIGIGFTRAGESTLWIFARLSNGALVGDDGQALSPGTMVHGLLTGAQATVERVEPHLHRSGDDRCVYPATLAVPPEESWEIWGTRAAIDRHLRRPTRQEQETFRSHAPQCVDQGDPPRCVGPTLLAVSDLDRDDSVEYWHTRPYTWDTGIRVAEVTHTGLVTLLTACPGCSD